MLLYEIKNDNINKLYSLYVEKGYLNNLDTFSRDLFKLHNNYCSFFKTIAIEDDNKIVASIQYGRLNNNEGVIRVLHCDNNSKKYVKELMLKATSYFYMIHISNVVIDSPMAFSNDEINRFCSYINNVYHNFTIKINSIN